MENTAINMMRRIPKGYKVVVGPNGVPTNHCINDHGDIYNSRTRKMVKPVIDPQGHKRLNIYQVGGGRNSPRLRYNLAKEVYRLFVDDSLEREEFMIGFKDGNIDNCNYLNLYVVKETLNSNKVLIYFAELLEENIDITTYELVFRIKEKFPKKCEDMTDESIGAYFTEVGANRKMKGATELFPIIQEWHDKRKKKKIWRKA